MTVQVASSFARKVKTRNLNGDVIDWRDDTLGGWIIKKGQIVNQEAYDLEQKKEQDRIKAAQAESMAIHRAPETELHPDQAKKVGELEERVTGMEGKLDAILEAINKKT